LTRSQCAGLAVDFLFGHPVFAGTLFVDGSEIPKAGRTGRRDARRASRSQERIR